MPNKTVTFGIDLLPLTSANYNLGSENKKWNIFGDVTGNAATATSAVSAKALANINGTYGTSVSTSTTTDRVFNANITHLANGGVIHFKIVGAQNGPTATTSNNSGNILHFHWDAGAWDSQLFVPHSTANSMAYRASSSAGTWGTWRTLLDSDNYSSYALPIDGTAVAASKITDITTTDAATNSNTWRHVWFSYNDNTTGRPAHKDTIAFQTSTNTLKSGKYLIDEHVKLEYNSTDESLDFVFI